MAEHAKYPSDWAQPAAMTPTGTRAADAHDCPNLAGRYNDSGSLAPNTLQSLCQTGKYRHTGDWLCDLSLGSNIGSLQDSGSMWVELKQPDSDTLVVVPGSAYLKPKELHRSKGDFDCKAGAIVRTLKASMMSLGGDDDSQSAFMKGYNAVGTFGDAFLATGGLRTLTRTFTKAADGSLVMHVEREDLGLMLAIPRHERYSTYISWPVDTSAQGEPAEQAPPSSLVARVLPTLGHAFGTSWYVAIDHAPIATCRRSPTQGATGSSFRRGYAAPVPTANMGPS